MPEWGTKRTDFECAKISLLCMPHLEYGIFGYMDDLMCYQGDESIRKAQRFAEFMSKSKGKELVEFIVESNQRIEDDEEDED